MLYQILSGIYNRQQVSGIGCDGQQVHLTIFSAG
jgi:hypothetical protein